MQWLANNAMPLLHWPGIAPSVHLADGTVLTLTPADLATAFPDTGGVNPQALAALKIGTRFTPNSTSVGDGLNTGGYLFNAKTPVDLNAHTAKIDWNATSHQTLFARMTVQYDHDGSAAQRNRG